MDARKLAHEPTPPGGPGGAKAGRAWWVLCGLAAFVAALFILEHRGHVAQWLPWLVLLACPLMHVVLHGRHGVHAGRGDRPRSEGDRRGR